MPEFDPKLEELDFDQAARALNLPGMTDLTSALLTTVSQTLGVKVSKIKTTGGLVAAARFAQLTERYMDWVADQYDDEVEGDDDPETCGHSAEEHREMARKMLKKQGVEAVFAEKPSNKRLAKVLENSDALTVGVATKDGDTVIQIKIEGKLERDLIPELLQYVATNVPAEA